MKVKELMKLLRGVSPDTKITCSMTTDDPTELLNMTYVEIGALKKYEIFCILKMEDCKNHEEECKLLIREEPYQYNPKGVRNK